MVFVDNIGIQDKIRFIDLCLPKYFHVEILRSLLWGMLENDENKSMYNKSKSSTGALLSHKTISRPPKS